jgi:hypothetical protein
MEETSKTADLTNELGKTKMAVVKPKSIGKINNNQVIKIIRETFHKWTESCDIHALPKAILSKGIARNIIWTFIFLTSACLCIYMLRKSVVDYFSYDVVTKVELFEETSTEFPQITICNTNSFVTNNSQSKSIIADYYSRYFTIYIMLR